MLLELPLSIFAHVCLHFLEASSNVELLIVKSYQESDKKNVIINSYSLKKWMGESYGMENLFETLNSKDVSSIHIFSRSFCNIFKSKVLSF